MRSQIHLMPFEHQVPETSTIHEAVCVCVTLGIIGILSDCFSFTVVFLVQQGRVALSSYHTQRSCGREWERKLGQFPVPAVIITPISGPCLYLKQEIQPLHRFALGSHA